MGGRWHGHTNRRTILALIFAGVITITVYISVIQAPDDFPVNTLVTIPGGATLSSAAGSFEKMSVVRSAFALELIMRLSGQEKDVHAGDYLFRQPEDVFTVVRAIAGGHYGLEPTRIRISEGATTKEMAAIFASYLQRFDKERFLLEAQQHEGFLFPDTYFFLPNATDELVLTTLRQNFDEHIKLLSQEIVAFGKPLKDVVIMASLLEREARAMEDRRKIAGVLWNRLDRGMLLQVDAAFLYTLGKGTFALTTNDLKSDDPYNTYINKGLPPGAIGSPSMDSLLAAVTPVKHEYLFYLADKRYVTHYSKTYEEHLKNKRKYID
ncbi:MAG: endolytic transglycosylase MltG, partial [Patescibacteria group bacterium]